SGPAAPGSALRIPRWLRSSVRRRPPKYRSASRIAAGYSTIAGMNSTQARTERRWGPRIQVDLPVRLSLDAGRVETGRMRNLSISGALIECAAELPTFTPLRVEVLAGSETIHDR